jgi:hypothetical protein
MANWKYRLDLREEGYKEVEYTLAELLGLAGEMKASEWIS